MNHLFYTTDISKAAFLSLFFPIEAIEKSHTFLNDAKFYFKRSPELESINEIYLMRRATIEPNLFFHQLENIKGRINKLIDES